jgi:hypothetical protein
MAIMVVIGKMCFIMTEIFLNFISTKSEDYFKRCVTTEGKVTFGVKQNHRHTNQNNVTIFAYYCCCYFFL